ncbi:hypothetical protein Lrub_1671 [Legionella rubrilucens]|uniref:Uncharacterized protein n=1 Tax=Legionella rubrilucens TaxID=458 RepID=A0A0W0XPX5_9GAMM|nr:hypothetical protein [Legionella rubrilucens]KTD46749.1 hypothetical protein Lrub_1671 [Legionella rubrilucens]
MPISYACLTSLKAMLQNYKKTGSSDTHYQDLLALLHKTCRSSHKLKSCADSDILLLLCNSASHIEDAPQFKSCVEAFLVDYQARTNALESFVDNKGRPIASDEFWKEENPWLPPEIPSALTLELKAVIAERERRLRGGGGGAFKSLNANKTEVGFNMK